MLLIKIHAGNGAWALDYLWLHNLTSLCVEFLLPELLVYMYTLPPEYPV